MDSYCVIHFKDKPEKVKILNFLAAETEAKYIVTADMKEYVAKQFHVKIMEYIDMNDQATDTSERKVIEVITIKDEVDDSIVDPPTIGNKIDTLHGQHIFPPVPSSSAPIVAAGSLTFASAPSTPVPIAQMVDPPTIDNNIDTLHEQPSDIADIQPSNNIGAQSATVVDMDDNVARLVEPKQEVIDEGIVGREMVQDTNVVNWIVKNKSVDNTPVPMQEDAPTVVVNNSAQSIFDRGVQQPVMNMDDYGTYVPYLERPVEPKEEVIEEGIVEQGRRNDVSDNITDNIMVTMQEDVSVVDPYMDDIDTYNPYNGHEEVAAVENDWSMEETTEDAPSSSRRSGRTTKRSKYSMDDDDLSTTRRSERICKQPKYLMDDDIVGRQGDLIGSNDVTDITVDNTPLVVKSADKGRIVKYDASSTSERVLKRPRDDAPKKPATPKSDPTGSIKNGETCQKCGLKGLYFPQKINHVLNHANIAKYECLVSGCGYKTTNSRTVGVHMKTKHMKSLYQYRKVELNSEQTKEYDKMMEECFPGVDARNQSKKK